MVLFAHLRSNSMGLDFLIDHLYRSLSTKDTIHTTWIYVKNIQTYVFVVFLFHNVFFMEQLWRQRRLFYIVHLFKSYRNIELQPIRLIDNALMSYYFYSSYNVLYLIYLIWRIESWYCIKGCKCNGHHGLVPQ